MRNIALHGLILAGAMALSACGGEPRQPPADETVTPVPSGPPVVQQIEAADETPERDLPAQAAPGWELRDSTLRLFADNEVVLAIECLEGSRIRVRAPGFTAISSEDRFSLGIGNEPVTLVAPDPMRQSSGTGVTAEAPMPGNFFDLLKGAKQVSAMYGNQRIGPAAPPAPAFVSGFAEAC